MSSDFKQGKVRNPSGEVLRLIQECPLHKVTVSQIFDTAQSIFPVNVIFENLLETLILFDELSTKCTESRKMLLL
jgi:acid phosphatase class B